MNTITIELSAEDRARLDRVAAALEALGQTHEPPIPSENRRWESVEDMAAFAKAAHAETLPEPETAVLQHVEVEAAEPQPAIPLEDVVPAAEAVEAVPVPTAEELQAVVQDLAKPGSPHRAAVRDIVKAVAERVSLIPEDKRAEVMERLQALKEGKA